MRHPPYDSLGRLTERDKVIGGTTYSTEYAYNLAYELTQLTYPSGRVAKQTYDAIGRFCGVGALGSTCNSGTTYASSIDYNAAQEITGFTYGNGVTANFGYSPDRLQMNSLSYANGSTTLFSLSYNYGSSGTNNGRISGITDNVSNGRTANYAYDGLGRLSTAVTAGSTAYPGWGLSWTYDRYGNRTAQTVTAGSALSDSLVVSASTNQITGTGYAYDASGNMTGDALNTSVYDAASKLISSTNGSSSGAYASDGNGLRVQKCVPNCTSPTTKTIYIFSGSRVLAEYDNSAGVTSPTREFIYANGKKIVTFTSSAINYIHKDHLSTRLITNSSGSVIEELGHFPFGDSWYDTGNEKGKFTTYERDSESGNDYAMARYMINRFGRFGSPDLHSGRVDNPQSLNRYTYVLNDPINLFDPLGLSDAEAQCYWDSEPDGPPSEGGATKQDCLDQGGTWHVPGENSNFTDYTWDADFGLREKISVALVSPDDSTQDTNPEESSLENSQDFATPEEIANDPLHQLFTNNANNPHGGDIINGTSQFVNASAAIPVVMIGGAAAAPAIGTAAAAVGTTAATTTTVVLAGVEAAFTNPTVQNYISNTLDFINSAPEGGDPVFTFPASTGTKLGTLVNLLISIFGGK